MSVFVYSMSVLGSRLATCCSLVQGPNVLDYTDALCSKWEQQE
jgi:hypothetical protein